MSIPLMYKSFGVRLDLLTFDYEEARKPGKTEAPAEKRIGACNTVI